MTVDGGWFTEGFDTLQLKEAEALLDELHAWRPISETAIKFANTITHGFRNPCFG